MTQEKIELELESELERVNAYVSPETKQWLTNLKKETGKKSYGGVLEELVFRQQHTDQNKLLGEILAKEISEQILGELKEPLDILRRRTGYSDRQTKIMTHLLNHMISTLQIDRIGENVVLADGGTKTNVLKAAEAKNKEQLDHFAQQAATKKAEREANMREGE